MPKSIAGGVEHTLDVHLEMMYHRLLGQLETNKQYRKPCVVRLRFRYSHGDDVVMIQTPATHQPTHLPLPNPGMYPPGTQIHLSTTRDLCDLAPPGPTCDLCDLAPPGPACDLQPLRPVHLAPPV
eukprot:gene8510-biopygen1377